MARRVRGRRTGRGRHRPAAIGAGFVRPAMGRTHIRPAGARGPTGRSCVGVTGRRSPAAARTRKPPEGYCRESAFPPGGGQGSGSGTSRPDGAGARTAGRAPAMPAGRRAVAFSSDLRHKSAVLRSVRRAARAARRTARPALAAGPAPDLRFCRGAPFHPDARQSVFGGDRPRRKPVSPENCTFVPRFRGKCDRRSLESPPAAGGDRWRARQPRARGALQKKRRFRSPGNAESRLLVRNSTLAKPAGQKLHFGASFRGRRGVCGPLYMCKKPVGIRKTPDGGYPWITILSEAARPPSPK